MLTPSFQVVYSLGEPKNLKLYQLSVESGLRSSFYSVFDEEVSQFDDRVLSTSLRPIIQK